MPAQPTDDDQTGVPGADGADGGADGADGADGGAARGAIGDASADASGRGGLDAVMRAGRVISAVVAESVAQIGDQVTMPQLRALVLVASRSEVSAGVVAEGLGVHPSSASRLCDRLVAAGLLERRPSAEDRRTVLLVLTPAGVRLLATVMEHRRRAFRQILDRIEPARRAELARALDAFADAAGEPSEDTLEHALGDPLAGPSIGD